MSSKTSEKSTHTLKLAGYPETAVRIINSQRNDEGKWFYTVAPGVKSKLYKDGRHVIANVPEYRLTPITTIPRRMLQEKARAIAAGYIQGCVDVGGVTTYCENHNLSELDDEYLVRELHYIIQEILGI